MRVHSSALKQKIAPEDAVQAAEWAIWIEPLTDEETPARELWLGFDTSARLLETVVLILDSGEELIIRAMPARKKYLDLLP